MQQVLWPVARLRLKDFAIDMLFEYKDDDGSTLLWCQGKVVDFIREVKDKHVFVKIEWCDKYVRDGDSKVTKNQLKKMKWNPNRLGERTYIINQSIRSKFSGETSLKQLHMMCVSMCVALWEVWGHDTVEIRP